ncbi:MAG TPA: PilZ domain-containing protein [Thermodesulfovibrionales bacterium]|nr:PilZ domain-containing protein [Thermodesulfovibrionales bacterium]
MQRVLLMNVGKRRHERFTVEDMALHAKAIFATEVDLLDVSMTGACFMARKSLKTGDRLLLRLHNKEEAFTIRCVIVWTTLSGSVKNAKEEAILVYRIGVMFQNVSSDILVSLKDFMRTFGVPDGEKVRDEYPPTALRFRIGGSESAVLYYHKTSPVKKISLGGMLMEGYNGIKPEWKAPMALFLPDENAPLKFRGRVASCIEIPGRRSTHYDIGVEFLDMPENDKSRLSEFLHSL